MNVRHVSVMCPRSHRQSSVKAGFKCRHCVQSWVHLPPCSPVSHEHLWYQWSSTEIHQGLFSFSSCLPETLEISFWLYFHDMFSLSVCVCYCSFLIFCVDSSFILGVMVWKLFSPYICTQIRFHSLSTMWRIPKCMHLTLHKSATITAGETISGVIVGTTVNSKDITALTDQHFEHGTSHCFHASDSLLMNSITWVMAFVIIKTQSLK